MKRVFLMLLVFSLIFSGISLGYGAETIKVGLITPLTGPIATFGQSVEKGVRMAVDEINAKGKYRGYLKENIPVKVAIRENKKGKLVIAYSWEYTNRTSLHIGLKYLKRMQCEQYHREIKSRLNLLDLNASYYKDAYNEDFLTRYLIVIMFAVILGIFLGKVFVERKEEYLKYVISEEQELSLLGLGIFLLNSDDWFVPIVLASFILSLKRGWLK